jgi:hypothetical protein
MRKIQNLGKAFVLSIVLGGSLVVFSPTLHAAFPGSPRSNGVRCTLIQGAIDAAAAALGADSALAIYLQGLYDANCAG